MSLKAWLSTVFRREVIAPLDKQILDEVRKHLSPEAQAIWDEQLRVLRRCQLILGTEADYYPASPDEPTVRFPHHPEEERRLAVVRFECRNTVYQARIHLVDGRFFSITYSRDVRRIRKRHDVEVKVLSVELLSDPMRPDAPVSPEVVSAPGLFPVMSGWLADWISQHPVLEMAYPMDAPERERWLNRRRLLLPDDYHELLKQCDGFITGDVDVFGISSMYEVNFGEAIYWVLAGRGGGFIVAREGDEQPRVYYFHHEDGTPSAEFTSFREALQYLIAQPNLP
ncbi:MAG: SMI1/KNR4 family protein [Firmicutes bacterium]|nr:SMI1/KNR4 family protein [Bacillota bacterium]